MSKFYAGIGSRKTPDDILELMFDLAVALATDGWTLRSGHADGADWAFELGASQGGPMAQIMLPWRGFNDKHELLGTPFVLDEIHPQAQLRCHELTRLHHPHAHKLTVPVAKLMDRNAMQVLGPNIDRPSSMVICWTPDAAIAATGESTGGTGQAIRIATAHDIVVRNLAYAPHRKAAEKYLKELSVNV